MLQGIFLFWVFILVFVVVFVPGLVLGVVLDLALGPGPGLGLDFLSWLCPSLNFHVGFGLKQYAFSIV